jgi:hypothetical protein
VTRVDHRGPPGYDRLFDGTPAKVMTRAARAAETILFFASDEAQARSKLPGPLESMGHASSLWSAMRFQTLGPAARACL